MMEATVIGVCFIEWMSLVIYTHLVQLNATGIKN